MNKRLKIKVVVTGGAGFIGSNLVEREFDVFVEPRIEPKHSLSDNSKAKEKLGWEPEISLEEGIKELLCVSSGFV